MAATSRLLTLLSLLQARPEWSGPALAERLGVSDRTVRRDVERLRELGYAISATLGSDGGYRLAAGEQLPPLLFDDDQVVALALALQVGSRAGAEIDEAGRRALATVRQVMPSRLRHRLDALDVLALAQRPGDAAPLPVSVDVLVVLAGVIRDRQTLRFDYASREPENDDPWVVRRQVEPHRIVAVQGRWLLLAWDLDREDWRLFSIDRITPRMPAGRRFAPRAVPGGDVEEFVAARLKGAQTNEWPCRGAVVLDLPLREVLPFVGDGRAHALGEERCVLEAGSWSWESLAVSYGRFEAGMTVLGPAELIAAFDAVSRRYRRTADAGLGDERGLSPQV